MKRPYLNVIIFLCGRGRGVEVSVGEAMLLSSGFSLFFYYKVPYMLFCRGGVVAIYINWTPILWLFEMKVQARAGTRKTGGVVI